jgi:short subunit dehydrogenase-like uncharacterized protein
MQQQSILIYGAYGFTGKLITKEAVKRGLQPILAGRDEQQVKQIAEEYNLPWEAFSLQDKEQLSRVLRGVDVVLHGAGPYSQTAKPMVEACLQQKCHYLDITGEIGVFEMMAGLNEEAEKAGICLMPGCGFDVVPTDCLSAFLHEQMPDATHLELAFKGAGTPSRGTALTMLENIDKGGMIRENGRLKAVPGAWKIKHWDYGKGPRASMTIPWGDVSTAYYTTGIPNITVYTAAPKGLIRFAKWSNRLGFLLRSGLIRKQMENFVRKKIKGPDARTQETGQSVVIGEVSNTSGHRISAKLITPEAYKLTAITAVNALQRILEKTPPAGFLTPALAFGADFILDVKGTDRQLLS